MRELADNLLKLASALETATQALALNQADPMWEKDDPEHAQLMLSWAQGDRSDLTNPFTHKLSQAAEDFAAELRKHLARSDA